MTPDSERRRILTTPILKRLDGADVIVMPRMLEGDLTSFFTRPLIDPSIPSMRDALLDTYVKDKNVLVVPGYSTNPYLFKHLGASHVYASDIDPVSLTWMTAVKDYYHYQNIGNVFMGAAHYPKVMFSSDFSALIDTYQTKETYHIYYVASAIQKAVAENAKPKPFEGVDYIQGALGPVKPSFGIKRIGEILSDEKFNFIYVPYLVGISNGISGPNKIKESFRELRGLLAPDGAVMMIPFSQSPTKYIREDESTRGSIRKLAGLAEEVGLRVEDEFATGPSITFGLLKAA